MIIEEWVENHAASNFQATYANAITAGYKEVDAYAFICNTCKGTHTAQAVISGITGNLGTGFNGMIWLDIEPCSGCWSSNGEANFEFAKTIATTLASQGHKIGIYSSGWAWTSVMPGVKSTFFSQYPLWYAHYDNVESFNDPNSYKFQGWTQPAMKQYLGDKQGQCNVPDYDVDWAPNFVNTNGPSAAPAKSVAAPSVASASVSSGKQESASAETGQADANNSASKSSSTKASAQCAHPASTASTASAGAEGDASTSNKSSKGQSANQSSSDMTTGAKKTTGTTAEENTATGANTATNANNASTQ